MYDQGIVDALNAAVADRVVPGMVLGVRNGDTDRFTLVAGMRTQIPSPEPMSLDTLFDLASLTKVLATTTITMRLMERRMLELDRPLADYCADLYSGDIGNLTPRFLLAHCAGLPASYVFYRTWDPYAPDPQAQRQSALRHRFRATKLVYEPGKTTLYSDIGLILLGDLIEHVCQARLDQVFNAEVAQPLKLADTFFRHLDDPLEQARRPAAAFAATEQCAWRGTLMRGWVHDENAYLLRGVAGHAGLFAPLTDVIQLAETLLHAYHGVGRYLQADTVHQFVDGPELVAGSKRFLGWSRATPDASCGRHFSTSAFGHTGFTGTSVWIDPELRRVVVLLSNRIHPARDNAAFVRFRPGLHDLIVQALNQT